MLEMHAWHEVAGVMTEGAGDSGRMIVKSDQTHPEPNPLDLSGTDPLLYCAPTYNAGRLPSSVTC